MAKRYFHCAVYSWVVTLLFASTVFGQDERLMRLDDFNGGINVWNHATRLAPNEFTEVLNFDPNLVNGSLASRIGLKRISGAWDVSSTYYAPYYRVFPVYDAQADTLSQLFYCGLRAAWALSNNLWGSGFQIGYASPSTPNTAVQIKSQIHANTTVNPDEWVGYNYNSVLRISTGADSVRWLNNRYPVRSSVWYTGKVAKNHSMLWQKMSSSHPVKFGYTFLGDFEPWMSDCNLLPVLWTKRGVYSTLPPTKPLYRSAITQTSPGNIEKKTYYAFAPIYDGYQHATMYEDTTGKMYVFSAGIDSPTAKSVTMAIYVDPFRIYYSSTATQCHSLPDSLGMMDMRITGFALYKTVLTYGDSSYRYDKSNYRLITSISAYDSAWSLGTYTYVDSTSYDDLSEYYYDVIGHFSDYDMAVYKYSAILNGRRYCAVVYKPTPGGQIFKNSDRVYYNPLQTWTDPPSYALDSFPDDHYLAIPEDNAIITGIFAYDSRLYVSTRTSIYRITPGVDPHDFSVETVYGSYPVDNQRTIQVTPDGIFYKTPFSVAYFNGASSQLIGEKLHIADSLKYNSSRIEDAFDSWYDAQKKEYWLFNTNDVYVFSAVYGSWRRDTFGMTVSSLAYTPLDVASIGRDSLYIVGQNATSGAKRVIFSYPSDSIYTYMDGDTSNTITKTLTTGRITMGSDYTEKLFSSYSVNANLSAPIATRSDSFYYVQVYLGNTLAQTDTAKFTGHSIFTQSIKSQRARDIKFSINSTNHKFVFNGLEVLWIPLENIITGQ